MTESVLFVCMGNICRSPTAEGVFSAKAKASGLMIKIDSAGILGYHAGENADPRAISAAKRRGYDLSKIKARQVTHEDFTAFDWIIAMDRDNEKNLHALAKDSGQAELSSKIRLFLEYSKQEKYTEVPDPYYGGDSGFDLVIDLIEDASDGLIDAIKKPQ